MSIETIVFDFGKVIAQFSHRQAAMQVAAYGKAPPDEILAFLFGSDLDDEYESGRIRSEEFIRRVCGRFCLTCTPDQFAVAYSDMFAPNHEVCALLPRLKPRYQLMLLSNTTELHSNHFVPQFADHFRWFDHLVLSHRVGLRKPQPAIYEYCQKHAGRQPEECLFIDDIPANVAGAEACGWQGIVYERGDDLAAKLAQHGVQLSAKKSRDR